MADFNHYRLGESGETIEFTSADENRAIVQSMAAQAGRSVWLFTTDLDPLIYDNSEFVEAIARMAREHQRARLQILVQDVTRAVKEGHRLIPLAQRLSSRVEIRTPIEEYAGLTENYLIADGVGYLRKPLPGRFDGVASFHNPLTARELSRQFEEIWERSYGDPQVRRLHI